MPPKEQRPSDQELTSTYQGQRNELRSLAEKISELEREAEEHTVVIESLKEIQAKDPKRKCFRLIGGVLVQRPVEEVLPSVQLNRENLGTVVTQLMTTYKKKETEHNEFQRKWNIQVVNR